MFYENRSRKAVLVRKQDIKRKRRIKEANEGTLPSLETEETDGAHPAQGQQPPHGTQPAPSQLTPGLCSQRREPDGLFTFNEIILEEIVTSQGNFLASSAILASKLTQEAWGLGEHSVRKERRDLDSADERKCSRSPGSSNTQRRRCQAT